MFNFEFLKNLLKFEFTANGQIELQIAISSSITFANPPIHSSNPPKISSRKIKNEKLFIFMFYKEQKKKKEAKTAQKKVGGCGEKWKINLLQRGV